MDAAFTEEQDEFRRTLRELLPKHGGPDDAEAAARNRSGHDAELWQRLTHRLGLPGLALPKTYGGAGHGPTELALACEELGRALLPTPLVATAALAAPLILALGSERQRAALLPAVAAGGLTGTLAVPGGQLPTALALTGPNGGDWAGGGRAGGIQARYDGGWRLYGEAGQVPDGHTAGVLLVAAHTGGYARSRTRLFLVRADGREVPGLLRTRQTAMDETRPVANVELREVEAELLGEDAGTGNGDTDNGDAGAVTGALAGIGAAAAAALAAEAVGAADAALARTVENVRAREQFGRAAASPRAVEQRLADLYVSVQAARSAAYYAAWSAGAGGSRPAEPGAGAPALAQALETLRAVAAEAVQPRGGTGLAREQDAQRYFKRAAGDELLLGPVHRLRARAAEESGLFAAPAGASAAAGA